MTEGSGKEEITGLELLTIVITCLNTALELPQLSVAIQVLVYVPLYEHEEGTNGPEVFVKVIPDNSQLLFAVGFID